MSFDDLREKPRSQNYFLRTDWSAVETKYKDGLKDFLAGIEIANSVLENPPYCFEPEKNIKTEPLTTKEVPKEVEKTCKNMQEQTNVSVESANVQGTNVCSLTLQPTQPQESVLSTPEVDPFDNVATANAPENYGSGVDLFDFVETKKPDPKPEAPKITIKIVDVDPFDVVDSSHDLAELNSPKIPEEKPATKPASAATPVAPQPTPVAPQTIPVATQAAEPAQPAKLASTPASAALNESCPSKASKNLEGYDYERNQEVRAICQRMMRGIPNLDLDGLMKLLPDYVVCLDLDHLRTKPHMLTEKIIEVQAKRDDLSPHLMQILPASGNMKKVMNYCEDVGLVCSSQGSREKRLAEFKFTNSDLYERDAQIETLYIAAQKTIDDLDKQYDCLSRLVTTMQNSAKEISRGDLPFEMQPISRAPAPVQQTPVEQPAPAAPKAPANGIPPRSDADDDFVNRQMSQPLQSSGKFKGLESFVSGTKPAPKTTEVNNGTSDVAW